MPKPNEVSLFLDSGAYSAYTQKTEIDLQEYISFIKEHEQVLEVYANLDKIPEGASQKDLAKAAEATWRNQRRMEKAGLSPLPTYHIGEPSKYLDRYISKYEYIALGAMVGIDNRTLSRRLDVLFSDYICDEQGYPKVKVHGFGLTSLRLMRRYPWYSVDSTSWVMTSRMGSVYIPKYRNGKWDYMDDSWKVCFSDRSPSKSEAGKHFHSMTKNQQGIIKKYLQEKGFEIGKSEYKKVDLDYELKDGEKWVNKKSIRQEKGFSMVETVIIPGLINDYKKRDEANIQYFLDLEKSFPPYPTKFLIKKRHGFL